MSHQRPFSSNFRRFKPRSTLFGDTSPDSNDMFGFDDPSWTFPRTSNSRFGSMSFDSPRSNTRPAFRSRNFDEEPFFRNRSWMDDDDPRMGRGHSPDFRRSPTPQSGSPSSQFFRSMDANGGIPIRVKREGSSRSSTPSNDSNEPDSPVPAPGVEKHAGVTSKLNSGNPQTAKRQPKVHHIPIRVEAREEETPGQKEPTNPSAKTATFTAPSQQSPKQAPPSPKQAPQSPKQAPQSPKQAPKKGKSSVHIIPMQVNDEAKAASKPSSPDPKPATPTPPLVKPTQSSVIETTLMDLERLKPRVEKFKGTRVDKEYLYLDEMLTRHLIKLDNIAVEGNTELRQTRKAAIKKVNECIHMLEANVVDDVQKENDVERKEDEPTTTNNNNNNDNNNTPNTEEKLSVVEEEKMDVEVAKVDEETKEKAENVETVANNVEESGKAVEASDAVEDSTKADIEMNEETSGKEKIDIESEPKTFTTTLNLQIT